MRPALTFVVTYWLCNELRRSGLHPIPASKTDQVKRTITGGYETGGEVEGGGFESVEEEQAPV
jgi:hypothetical protein